MQQIEVSSVGASAGCLLSGNSVQRLILGRNLNDAIDPQRTKRLKELETENGRLRRAVSDLTLDKLILAEAATRIFEELRRRGYECRGVG